MCDRVPPERNPSGVALCRPTTRLYRSLRARLAEAFLPRRHIASLLPLAGGRLVAVTALLNLVLGLLPVVFVVATSIMLGELPSAVHAGSQSAAWRELLPSFVVCAGAVLGQQILAVIQTSLGELIARRVDGAVFQRLMTASLSVPGIADLEDPALRDELAEAGRELEHGFQSPGRACAGLLALLTRYVQLAGYVAVVGVGFSWPVAAGVLTVPLLFRYGQRGGLRRYSALFPRLAGIHRRSDYLRDLSTGVSAAKEIRVFGLTDWLVRRYHETSLAWMRPIWVERRRIYLKPFLRLTAVGLLLTSAALIGAGTGAGGPFSLTRFALAVQAALAALRLGDHYPEADVQTQFGMNAYDAVRGVEKKLMRPDETRREAIVAPSTVARDPRTPCAVRFAKVGFHYPGQDRPVFDDLDLSIEAGRCTALVGLNGAGKTTLVKLLARLYEPSLGAILVDGVDLASLPHDAWRRRLSVVFQDFQRYETTVRLNIGFGATEHLEDEEGILAVAQKAGVGDLIHELPDGLETPLSSRLHGGVELSGGQWQRMAMARALFSLRHGADLLVLDEPTASLDVRAEARFYDDFINLTKGTTTLLISHRFATVRRADAIAVLSDGKVVERGTHEELLRLDGRYAELFHLQAMRFDVAEPSAIPATGKAGTQA